MKEDLDKLVTLVSFGMDPDGIEDTWAWNHFEEAKRLQSFFDEFIHAIKL